MRLTHSLIVLFFGSLSAFAGSDLEVTIRSEIPLMNYRYGPGSELDLSNGKGQVRPGILLGRTASPEKKGDDLLVLDVKKKRILYVDHALVDTSMRWSEIFPYADPVEQSEDTCAAYAMYNLVQQFSTLGLIDGPKTVEENVRLIGYFLNEYYLNGKRNSSFAGILNSKGKEYGFSCKRHAFSDRQNLLDAIDSQLDKGLPVLIEFDIGSDMVSSSYDLVDYESDSPKKDPRLWVPRQQGQKNGGGHAIVLASSFDVGSDRKYVALDSDWTDPRIWDVRQALGSKIRMDDIDIIDCKPTN